MYLKFITKFLMYKNNIKYHNLCDLEKNNDIQLTL